ncbi:MerR family transcriptional regulator [Xylocopilactobacillus apicola]|uniref:MerR family transcriptional regulator n=1 Tax=Xylocopilactobacillus apicola TaxID=2932184 RepID=A0AAU9D4I0_9LACO|nr:MerR family transcriptional regulator [Xylocopilactobacillus apicola]BDR58408.1 MerR family transcriptional regulator [Xylocopilactobacillus apicola]
MSKEIKRDLPILSLQVVMALTDLSARQIRYYEEKKLITYHRTDGHQRVFSLNDLDELLIIKEMLDSGETIKEIQQYRAKKTSGYQTETFKPVTDEEARDIFRNEMMRYLEIGKNNLD